MYLRWLLIFLCFINYNKTISQTTSIVIMDTNFNNINCVSYNGIFNIDSALNFLNLYTGSYYINVSDSCYKLDDYKQEPIKLIRYYNDFIYNCDFEKGNDSNISKLEIDSLPNGIWYKIVIEKNKIHIITKKFVKNFLLDGDVNIFDKNGKCIRFYNVKSGYKNETEIAYYPSGVLYYKNNYNKGVLCYSTCFYKNGSIKSIWIAGDKEYFWDENGNILEEGSIDNENKMHGRTIKFDSNGKESFIQFWYRDQVIYEYKK
jgi:antitoxin component YwqK of YwqJK toxin-antitoxin module